MSYWDQKNTIPFNILGTAIFIFSMLFNLFGIYIICIILLGRVQLRQQVKYLMLFCNFNGILWNIVSVLRYYHYPFPELDVVHYTLGSCMVIGDLLAQFETLKLFHCISNLRPRSISISEWISFGFCVVCTVGNYLTRISPTNAYLQLWGDYGAVVTGSFIVIFYIWYQFFLTTKLYQSMQIVKLNGSKRQLDQTSNYVNLILEFTLLGLYQLAGLGIWAYGMMAGFGTIDVTFARKCIRAGECVAQSHVGLSVLFLKRIKEFKFPRGSERIQIKDNVQKGHSSTILLSE